MAIYNAYCDQAPLFVVAGNISDAAERRGRVEWLHAAQDVAATVRDYTKWDDNPASLTHFGESAVRAYQIAMTAPMMPVVLAADGVLQEGEVPKEFDWRIPKLPKISAPAGDSEAVAELAQMLVSAENPVIVTSRSARTPAGLEAAGGARGSDRRGSDRSAAPYELSVAPSAESNPALARGHQPMPT